MLLAIKIMYSYMLKKITTLHSQLLEQSFSNDTIRWN